MHVVFIGNVNNYPFMLARAMRNMGVKVTFIVISDNKLERPEYKYSDINYPYPDWIVELSPIGELDIVKSSEKIRKLKSIVDTADAIVVNQHAIMLAASLDRPAIVLLTGSDLDYYASWKFAYSQLFNTNIGYIKRLLALFTCSYLMQLQRRGIRKAIAVNYFPKNVVPLGDKLLDKLKVFPPRRTFFMMSDTDSIPCCEPPVNQIIRVFCATRLSWISEEKTPLSSLDYKGTDIMIKGIALFIKETGIPLDVRLVEKGKDVGKTKQLIANLGIEEYITWNDEMTQIEVNREYVLSDIVFEQLGNSFVTMAGLDAMATGRPVIANARPDIIDVHIKQKSPVCHAVTPEDVKLQLSKLVSSRELRKSIGEASRNYVVNNFSAISAARLCLDKLASVVS